MSAFNLDGIIKEIKKGAKQIRKEIPKNINDLAEEAYQLKRLQKTFQKQGRKIKEATLITLAEQVMKNRGYTVSQEENEIVAKKGKSKVLVGFMAKTDTWAERMKEASCTKGLVLTLEPASEEDSKSWKKLKTEVLSSKNLMDWIVSE